MKNYKTKNLNLSKTIDLHTLYRLPSIIRGNSIGVTMTANRFFKKVLKKTIKFVVFVLLTPPMLALLASDFLLNIIKVPMILIEMILSKIRFISKMLTRLLLFIPEILTKRQLYFSAVTKEKICDVVTFPLDLLSYLNNKILVLLIGLQIQLERLYHINLFSRGRTPHTTNRSSTFQQSPGRTASSQLIKTPAQFVQFVQSRLDNSHLKDPHFLLQSMKIDERFMLLIDKSLLESTIFIANNCASYPQLLLLLPQEQALDEDLILKCLEKNDRVCALIHPNLLKSPSFIIKALKITPKICPFINSQLLAESAFMLEAIKAHSAIALFIDNSLKSNPRFMKKLIAQDNSFYCLLPESLKNCPNFMIKLLSSDDSQLLPVSDELSNNKSFMIDLVKLDKASLFFLSNRLKLDINFTRSAIEITPHTLAFISGGFTDNETLMLDAFQADPQTFFYLSGRLKRDATFVSKALESIDEGDSVSARILLLCCPHLFNSKQHLLEMIASHPQVLSLDGLFSSLKYNLEFASKLIIAQPTIAAFYNLERDEEFLLALAHYNPDCLDALKTHAGVDKSFILKLIQSSNHFTQYVDGFSSKALSDLCLRPLQDGSVLTELVEDTTCAKTQSPAASPQHPDRAAPLRFKTPIELAINSYNKNKHSPSWSPKKLFQNNN